MDVLGSIRFTVRAEDSVLRTEGQSSIFLDPKQMSVANSSLLDVITLQSIQILPPISWGIGLSSEREFSGHIEFSYL